MLETALPHQATRFRCSQELLGQARRVGSSQTSEPSAQATETNHIASLQCIIALQSNTISIQCVIALQSNSVSLQSIIAPQNDISLQSVVTLGVF
jgi:hypothetical protein